MRKFNETYLYRKMPEYDRDIHALILKGDRIDKTHESFSDIKYEIKRKNIDASLVKLIDSDRIVLVLPAKPMPKSFRIITARDIRNDKKVKVFVDCTGLIIPNGTGYSLANASAGNILISYLIAARTAFIIEYKPALLTGNSSLTQSGTKAFASLVNYVVDYIGKININVEAKNKCLYLASIYYQVNLLGKDIDFKSVKDTAMKISGISERQANIIELDYEEDSFNDIEKFINLIQNVIHVKGLTIDTFIERWMFLFGTGTIFATELFVYFAQMMSDAYIGAYINNQKTIEKVARQDMIEFTKTLIRVGSDS